MVVGGAPDSRDADASAIFFATAPAAPIAAGALLLLAGSSVLVSTWSPKTLALTHLGTLLFLVMPFVGGFFHTIPGAAESRVRGRSVPRLVHAGLCVGIVTLVVGILGGWSPAWYVALAALALALVLFFYSVGGALLRKDGADIPGARTAVASLLLTAFLGLWMGHWHVGVPFHGDRSLWIQIHLSLGMLGWAGGAIGVLYRSTLGGAFAARSPASAVVRATVSMVQVGIVGVTLVAVLDLAGDFAARNVRLSVWAAVAAAPAAVAVWGIQPSASLRAIAGRGEATAGRLVCWRASFALAFVTAAIAVAALSLSDPRWNLLFGWSAIWGWSGFFVHGLIGGDRSSADAVAPATAARRIANHAAFGLHAISFALGVAAIATGDELLARLTGVALIGTGVGMVRDRRRAGSREAAAAPPAEAR